MRKVYATVKKKHQLSIIIEIEITVVSPCAIVRVQECLSRSIRRLSPGRKGFYSSSWDLLDSGLKLNSDISKESSSLSVLKPVPRLSDGPAWVEENQWNELAFGELTG